MPEAMLGDKGYDSDAIRFDLKRRGIDPVIPTKSNRKVQLTIDKTAYAMRNRIERLFNKIKHLSRGDLLRQARVQLPRVRATRNDPMLDQVCPHDLDLGREAVSRRRGRGEWERRCDSPAASPADAAELSQARAAGAGRGLGIWNAPRFDRTVGLAR